MSTSSPSGVPYILSLLAALALSCASTPAPTKGQGGQQAPGAAAKPQAAPAGQSATQSSAKPNILVIWGDDIGVHNISAYNHGVMGYRTPNIDRIAKEGA